MSSPRTSSASASTSRTTTRTASSSSVSVVSPAGPTHTPSDTPVIAGSLAGGIVLTVCVVILLLLEKRRRRLRAERTLHANQRYPGPGNFSSHRLNKRRSLNGFEERSPPQIQDSASSSGSSPSQVAQPLNHTLEHPPPPRPPPHESPPVPQSPRRRHGSVRNDRSTMNPQDHTPTPSLPPSSTPHHKPGQSSSSSNTRSRTPPLSPSQSHTGTATPLVPRTRTQYPQMNALQITSESSVPRGHVDGAVVDVALGNNNMVSASPSAIFGQANSSDAAERTANTQGFAGGGSRAGLPSIVVTRDATGDNLPGSQGGRDYRTTASDVLGQTRPSPVNGMRNGNGSEGGRSGTPVIPGGCNHTQSFKPGGEEDHSNDRQQRLGTSKSQASASGPEYSYPPSGSGSGSTEGAGSGSRTGESDKVGLTAEFAGHGRPRTTSDATSGSLPPTSVPSTPVPSTPTQPRNLPRQNIREPHEDRRPIAEANNTQVDTSSLSSTRQGQSRSYLGHMQAPIARSRFGDASLAVEDVEDAPPAYENVWASTREEERFRVERRRREHEQEESRTQ